MTRREDRKMRVRPSSNKNSFPVHRLGGLKRAYWNFFFPIFNFFFLFYFPPLYILIYKKKKLGDKQRFPTSRLAFFLPTRLTGNNFLLKGGLMSNMGEYLACDKLPPYNHSEEPSGVRARPLAYVCCMSGLYH